MELRKTKWKQQMHNFSNYFLVEADKTTHVTTFMRANPPTIGHERVVNHVMELANNLDAGHSIVLSHSHDGDKNPLTAEQKLRHAKLAFPGANVSTSSPESPSLLHHVAKLHAQGVRNLHLVVGQDRVEQFQELLNKYNGVEGAHHGYFNFDNINVHSAGGRDPDAEGVEGVSGTAQRNHARLNNFEGFRAGAPSRMNDEQAAALMNDIRNAKPPEKPPKPTKPAAKKTSKPKAEPFNPGTSVLVQHGSHSQEPKIQMPYQEMLNSTDYPENRDEKVNHLQNANDHIAKGGPEKVDAALQKQYKSNPHVEHLKQYSESSFDLNHALLDHHNEGGDPNEMPMIADWDHIEGLDNALNHSKTKKPMTVFSGVGFNPGKMAEKHPENNLYMPSYTSTSIDPKVASTFSKPLYKDSTGETMDHMYDPDKDEKEEGADNHILRINIPKGHSGAYMGGTSSLPEEKEFLLPRQQTMKIHPTPETHEFTDGYVTHRMHIWDATPVPTKLPKPVTEETVSGGLMVRGFGDVSGNPAVQDNPLQQYINTNALAKDQQNGALMKMMKDTQFNLIGFKEFNPHIVSRDKTLPYYEEDPNGDPLLRDKIRNKGKNNNVTKG
jgi:hypothetical protein